MSDIATLVDRFHRDFRHPGWQPIVTWTVIVDAELDYRSHRETWRRAFVGFDYKPTGEEMKEEDGKRVTLRWRCTSPMIRYERIVPRVLSEEEMP